MNDRAMFSVDSYQVVFLHWILDEEEKSLIRRKARTTCFIYNGDGYIAYDGDAWCSLKDPFIRSVGRKLALSRAVEGMPKDMRTKIWDKYWSVVGGPK